MREFRKIAQVKKLPLAKPNSWPEYDITFEDGEVLSVAVPTGVNYTPEQGDEINPFKNKAGSWQITDKGYRKGRGVVEKSQPNQSSPTESREFRGIGALTKFSDPSPFNYVPDLFEVFSTILPVYTNTISNRSNTEECDLAVSKCLAKAKEVLAEINNPNKESEPDKHHQPQPSKQAKEATDPVDYNSDEIPF